MRSNLHGMGHYKSCDLGGVFYLEMAAISGAAIVFGRLVGGVAAIANYSESLTAVTRVEINRMRRFDNYCLTMIRHVLFKWNQQVLGGVC